MAKRTKSLLENNQTDEAVRINKYLSDAGICSRREADKYIAAGEVTVDGITAGVGTKVVPGQKVLLKGKEVRKEEQLILIAFNKPVGIVSTTDTNEPDNIIDFINYGKRIYPIGRLDKDSEGLILLTNDGNIVNKILRAGNNHEKEYIVTVNKQITSEFLKGMADGVPILDTVTRPCRIKALDRFTFQIILTQGLNRQIRRMCEYFGYKVLTLQRIRIMNIKLGHLHVGGYRNVTEKEIEGLNELLSDSISTSYADWKTEDNSEEEYVLQTPKKNTKRYEKSLQFNNKVSEKRSQGVKKSYQKNNRDEQQSHKYSEKDKANKSRENKLRENKLRENTSATGKIAWSDKSSLKSSAEDRNRTGRNDYKRTAEERSRTGRTDFKGTAEGRNRTGRTDFKKAAEGRNQTGRTEYKRTAEGRNQTGRTDYKRTTEGRNQTESTEFKGTAEGRNRMGRADFKKAAEGRNQTGRTDFKKAAEGGNQTGRTDYKRTAEGDRNRTGRTDFKRTSEGRNRTSIRKK